ncbi:hypothetical protein Csa_005610 [Cucumis sativus]|uniref:Uncharacterized protein n=1 Tax=Cucumis sativus TaxID=3659 RepID=A0A0A0KAV1_CUCSA|nr:hypothetical protein Csa_005610 [Cucumis sativus]
MSAGFDLAVIGALLQLCFSSLLLILGSFKQSLNLLFSSVSMRLRPKRTCSGVKCFGAFHIKRFSFLLLLFRKGGFT